jgi:hypothetical protein
MYQKLWVYRVVLIGLLSLALAAAIVACGTQSDSGSTQGSAAYAAVARCEAQYSGLVETLDRLRGLLTRELAYREYVSAVRQARAVYDQISIGQVGRACLKGVGLPTERILNAYVHAADTWTRCLAKDKCDPETVRPVVEKRWWKAGLSLSALHTALPGFPTAYDKSLQAPPH